MIFTSQRRTPRIHAYGEVILESIGLSGAKYIEFPPTLETPQLFVANSGLWGLRPHPQLPNVYYRLGHVVEPFEKNASGEYYRARIQIQTVSVWAPPSYINETPLPWRVPWVVFI